MKIVFNGDNEDSNWKGVTLRLAFLFAFTATVFALEYLITGHFKWGSLTW